MSFCPSKDIHSLYLDNELPEIYKAEYEEHLKTCKNCQLEFERISQIHKLLNSDAKLISPSKEYLDESYARLLTKMNFSKNTSRKSSFDNKKSFKNIGYFACAAAAVAVFAFVMPLKTSSKNQINSGNVNVASLPEIIANKVSFYSGNNNSISDNINTVGFGPEMTKENSQNFIMNVNSSRNSANQKRIRIIPDNDVELLRPELDSISIKITLPGIDSVPMTTEINVPMEVVSGRK